MSGGQVGQFALEGAEFGRAIMLSDAWKNGTPHLELRLTGRAAVD